MNFIHYNAMCIIRSLDLVVNRISDVRLTLFGGFLRKTPYKFWQVLYINIPACHFVMMWANLIWNGNSSWWLKVAKRLWSKVSQSVSREEDIVWKIKQIIHTVWRYHIYRYHYCTQRRSVSQIYYFTMLSVLLS